VHKQVATAIRNEMENASKHYMFNGAKTSRMQLSRRSFRKPNCKRI